MGTRAYPFTFTQNVADTWEYKTVVIPGDVTGVWIGNTNGIGLIIAFSMASGSTYLDTANTWAAANLIGTIGTTNGVAATSDVFQITGVCLLPGTDAPSAAVSPLIKRSFDQELLLCQRYYFSTKSLAMAYGVYAASPGVGYNVTEAFANPVPMRITPTCTVVGTWAVGSCGQPTVLFATPKWVSLTGISTAPTGQCGFWSVAGSAYHTADARL